MIIRIRFTRFRIHFKKNKPKHPRQDPVGVFFVLFAAYCSGYFRSMDDQKTISLYEAIAMMRKITAEGGFFSFGFASWNHDTGKSNGVSHVKRARLRPAASTDSIRHADFKLFYWDDYYQEDRNCWQMLIMYFNNTKIILQ